MYLCNMKDKVLQPFAELILRELNKSTNKDVINFYFELGIWFDNFCIKYFNLYLD